MHYDSLEFLAETINSINPLSTLVFCKTIFIRIVAFDFTVQLRFISKDVTKH